MSMDLHLQLEKERAKFRSIQQIARAIGSTLDIDQLLHLIVGKITELMDADRSTLYVMAENRTELWTKVLQADDLREIRLKIGEGIAGWVAQTGQTVKIEDAYQDERFHPEIDQRSGYRTRSILCTPMQDNQGKIIGVVQVLNKKGGLPFTDEDKELLVALVSQASIAIENSQLYLSVVRNNEQLLQTQEQLQRRMLELDLLLEVEKETNAATSIDELLEHLLLRTAELIGTEAASILLKDEKSKRLYFSSALGKYGELLKTHYVPIGEGIAGWVAEQGEPLIINNPHSDPRYYRDLADKIGFTARNILCVPLEGQDDALGAIELLNKAGKPQFEEADKTLLSIVAGRIARAIELARVKEEQLKQNRLASIGQLLSSIMHDLKTPMTVISGYAQLMATCDDATTRDQYAELILKQFEVMSSMTREVLSFAKGESNLLIRKVFLYKFIEEMEEHLKLEFADKNIELVINQNYRGTAYLDVIKFRRVFQNIAVNAAQAMPNGGVFTITVDSCKGKLIFIFQDNGPGIPPELEGRIFDIFATAGKKDGTGLGLAIVQKIVNQHDGEITYQSAPGTGTTFTITMPIERPSQGAEVAMAAG